MLTAILETIATYEREAGVKPKALTIGMDQYTSLLAECYKMTNMNIEGLDDPYSGIYIMGVRIEWENWDEYE